jgi:hypothetical protein
MRLASTRGLIEPENTKIVLLVLDGLGGLVIADPYYTERSVQ